MKEILPIMTDAEFAGYLDKLEKSVREGIDNGQDYNTIRCRLIGCLEQERIYAFTGEQLKKVFDLGFPQSEADLVVKEEGMSW